MNYLSRSIWWPKNALKVFTISAPGQAEFLQVADGDCALAA